MQGVPLDFIAKLGGWKKLETLKKYLLASGLDVAMVAVIYMSLSFTSYLVLENFVKPNILDKKLNLHPFLLFLALLGGIQQFGIVGLVIGPIAITILVILWDFWMAYRRKEIISQK